MADKKSWRDLLEERYDGANKEGADSKKTSSWREKLETKLETDSTEHVGKNVVNRVNSWLKNHNSYISDYQKRYEGRKHTYEDAYVSDSAEWLDQARQRKSSLDKEAEDILAYIDQYAGYLDENWVNEIRQSIRGAKGTQGQILNTYRKDNEFWNSFSSEELIAEYGSGEEAYKKQQQSAMDYKAKSELDIDAAEQEIVDWEKTVDDYSNAGSIYWQDYFATEADRQAAIDRYMAYFQKYGIDPNAYSHDAERDLALANAIRNRRDYIDEAKKVQERNREAEVWNSYRNSADFDIYEAQGAAIENPTFSDAENSGRILWWSWEGDEVGNIVTYSREHANELAMAQSNNSSTQGNYMYRSMEEDEVKLYNYLLAKYGKEKGYEYLSYLMEDLKAREGGQMAKRLQSIDVPVVEEVAIGLFGLAAGLDQWASGARQFLTSEKQSASVEQYANSELLNSMDGLGKYAYQATNVIGNMLPSIVMSKGLGALGAGMTAARAAGSATMFIGAAGNAYADGLEYGMEPWQARTYSTLVGAAEVALENVMGSVPGIGKADDFLSLKIRMIDNGLLRVGAKIGWDTVKEIGEEELQNFLEPLFRSFFTGEYDVPTFDELLETAIVTAISTPGMSGLGTAVDDVRGSKRAFKQYGDKTDALIQEGLESDVNTDSYKLATKYQKQVQGKDGKRGKALTGNQIRNLLAANQEQITAKDLKKIQTAAEARLIALGQTENVGRLAEIATKWATGQKTTRAERSLLANSEYGSQVANELLPENIISGDYSSEWAEGIGTKQVNALAYNIRNIVDAMTQKGEYKPLESRVEGETSAELSTTGEAVVRSTDEAVDLSTARIKAISADSVVLDVNGADVDIEEIDFATDDQWIAYNAVKKIEHITPGAANALIAKVDFSKPVWAQLNGMDEAFNYGYYNYSEADLNAGLFTGNLTKEQLTDAYRLGQIAAENSQTDKANRFKAMRAAAQAEAEKAVAEGKKAPKAKKMTITYNAGNGKIVDFDKAGLKLTDNQKSAPALAKVFHEMGLGTNFELFASYVNKDGVRVFLDENGVEQKAPSGVYRMKDGTVRIDLNAYNGRGLTLDVMAHELTHFIQQWSDTKYQALAEFLVKTYEKTDMSMHERVLREQTRLEGVRGEDVSYNEAFDEVVANAMSKMLADGKVMERLIELKAQDADLARKLWAGLKRFLNKFFRVAQKQSALFHDTADLMELKAEFKQMQKMWAEAFVEASENYQASVVTGETQKMTTQEDGQMYSVHTRMTDADIQAVQSIGKKSVNAFSASEIQATERFARQYWKEMGVKSPFFRAWFGDWRVNDQRPVNVATKQGDTRANHLNKDTGWIIRNSGKVHDETKNHKSKKNREAVPYLPYIDEIIENAVLLDTVGVGTPKSENSLLMHYLYVAADIGNGQEVLKLTVEEMYDPGARTTNKRAYTLQNIEKAFATSGRVQGNPPSPVTSAANAIHTVADLFTAVKQMDADFQPKPASKVVDTDGAPKIVHHGSAEQFTAFSYGSIGSSTGVGILGDGFYFTDKKQLAKNYGDNVYPVYLQMKNPYAATESDAYKLKVADLQAKGYDGVIMHTPKGDVYMVFENTQIKSATDNIGTFDGSNPDIRYSSQETDADGYSPDGFKDYDIVSAVYTIRNEKAKRGHGLVEIGNMPTLYRKLFGLSGKVYVSNEHLYRNMVSRTTAETEGRFNPDASADYHDLGEEKIISAIEQFQDPLVIMESLKDFNEPRLVAVLDEKGNDGENLIAVMELYAPIAYPGKNQRRNHVLITIYEKNSLPDYIEKTVDKDRILYKKEGLRKTRQADLQLVGAVSKEALKKNVARFNRKVKAFKEENKIYYSTQETDYSNRDLLANAFEGITKSSPEYELIQEYKSRIKLLNEQEAKLDELNAEIRRIRFTAGEYDAVRLRALEEEAESVAKEINRHDRKLLALEASEPLRKLIDQERKKTAQKTGEHIKQIQQNKKARAEQTQIRHKIRKAIRDLDRVLNRGNKKLNVKEDMRGFVSKALELSDYLFTDHISNDELIRNGITVRMTPQEAKLVKETEDILSRLYDGADSLTDEEFTRLDAKRKANEDKLRDLLTAQRNERLNTPVYNLFNDLVTEYASLRNSSQDAVRAAYNVDLERLLRQFMGDTIDGEDTGRKAMLQNMRVADMTTEELTKLYEAYKMVLTNVRDANKVHAMSKYASIDEIVRNITADFTKRKIPDKKLAIIARNIANKIGWDYEKLYYALDRIGSEAFTELVMNIANSENIVMQDVIDAHAFLDEMVEKYGFNNWDVNKEIDREFVDNNGKKFKLTLGQLMALYAYSRRAGAWDHIEYGGFVFGEAALTNPRPADSYKLSKAQCEAITDLLTKEQKGYAEEMQRYLSDTMGAKGNEVSMLLYGINLFGEKHYFPIHIAGQFKAQAQESQAKAAAGFGTMSNAGFTHAQNPNAKAPFVLEGFNEIWVDHVNEMSRYHGTVPALEDMRRVMNRSSYSDTGMESTAIKQLMENTYGKEAVEYFDNLYREANSGAVTDKLQKKSQRFLGLFRKNSVAYSLSVAIQQPASLVRAYAMIDRKYFGFKGFGTITSGLAKAVTSKWNPAYDEAYAKMLKYAPGVTMAKQIGGFDTHTGMSIRSYLLDTGKKFKQKWKTGTAKEKGKAILDIVDDNAIANLPNVADKIAWIEIWNACERETIAKHKDLSPDSEEFLQAVGERFTEVIRATQVYDSIFAKSPVTKSRNLAVQYLVSFWNEPNTVVNMAEKAVRDVARGDWKAGLKTATVVIHSIIFTNMLKSLIYAMRDDDEEETFIEKYIEAVSGNIITDFNPLSYIPLGRDALSKAQGYDVERPDMAIIADAIDAVQAKIKAATKDAENMTEEQLIELDKTVTEANWKLVESIAALFGIPVKNVHREVEGILDHARIAYNNAGKTTVYSAWDKLRESVINSIPFMSAPSKQDRLYDAIISGDKAYADRLKSTYKTDDAYHTAVRKALRENDSRIHDAAQARYDGNTEEYKRIFREIQGEGYFSFDDIMSAINSEENAIKGKMEPEKATSPNSASDFVEAIVLGDTKSAQAMKEDIIATKVANGRTREEAEKEFASAVTTGIRDAYASGLLDKAGAEKMLMEYAGKNEKESVSKVRYWAFCEEHPECDLTEANVNDYVEFAEPADIPLDVFVQYINRTKGLAEKKDEWGNVEVTKREQVLEVIDSLPLTWKQKDALYLASGYSENKIWDVPW